MNPKRFSRRDFLRVSAVTAAGALSAGALSACTPTPTAAPVQPTKAVEPTKAPAQPQPPAATAGKKVKVTFMVPGSTQEDADFAPVFEAFNKMYPDIEGSYTPAGTGYTPQYDQKLMTMFAGGVAPDVFKTQTGNFGAFGAMGVYLPLDALAQANPDITRIDDFFEPHINGCKINGKLMALPNDGAPQAMWYNVDLWKAANLKMPDWDLTWDTLTEAAKSITVKQGNVTTQHGLGRPNWIVSMWSDGAEIISQDGKKCLLDSPEAIEAFTWMQSLVQKLGVTPTAASLSEMNEGDRFTTGKIGAVFGVRGSLGAYRSIEKFTFDAAPMVMSNKKKRVTTLAIGWTSVYKDCKAPNEAYKLAAFVASAEGQRLRISRGYAHPSRKSLVEQDWFKSFTCPKCGSNKVNMIFPEMLLRNEARVWPPYPQEAKILQAVNTNLDALWDGSKTPETLAKDITKAVDAVLA